MIEILSQGYNPHTATKALLLLFPVALHLFYIFNFSLNVPWIDDYYWYFKFVKDINEHSFTNKFIAFLEPYNGHLHTFQRIVYLILLGLFNNIDVLFFTCVGNTFFVLLFGLIISQNVAKLSGITYREIALSCIFFQPVSYYNFFECAFFNLPVLLFAYLSIYYLLKNKIAYAVLLSVICTTVNGNGFLIWLVGILIAIQVKNWQLGLLYFMALLFSLAVYIVQSSDLVTSTDISVESLWHSLLYYVQLLGKITDWTPSMLPWISIPIGCLLLIAFLLNLKKFTNHQKGLLFFMLFMLMSMGLIALKRKAVLNGVAIIVDHYLMYPQLFLGCLLYTIALSFPVTTTQRKVVLLFAITLALTNYVIATPRIAKHRDYQIANALNYKEQKKWLLHPVVQGANEYTMANNVTEYVIHEGYYNLPDFKIQRLKSSCQLEYYTQEIAVTSHLKDRILNRTLLIELTDVHNVHYYFPIEPHGPDLLQWLRSRKNKRVAITISTANLNDPIDCSSLVGCSIVEITR